VGGSIRVWLAVAAGRQARAPAVKAGGEEQHYYGVRQSCAGETSTMLVKTWPLCHLLNYRLNAIP